jgi:ABC-2 type transport system permease protein
MNSLQQLFLANFRMFYRNRAALFFSFTMPVAIYVALSVLPLGKLASGNERYTEFVLPGIVAMTIMQAGIYGLAYWLIDLQSRGVIKRLLVTPIKTRDLVISLVASRLTVILAQVALLTFIGAVFFRATFAGNVLSVTVLSILGGAIFLLVGLLISRYANSYEAAAPITAAIGLPLAFLSNVFYPLEALPPVLQTVAKGLPITYLADGLRKSYLEPFNFTHIGTDILALCAWLAALLALTLWLFTFEE